MSTHCNLCGFKISKHAWQRHQLSCKSASAQQCPTTSQLSTPQPINGESSLLLPVTRWREDHFVTDTAVRQIKSDVTDWATTQIREKSTEIAARLGVDCDQVENALGLVLAPFQGIETTWKEKAAANRVLQPIQPDTRELGRSVIELPDGTTKIIKDVVVDVQVKESLDEMLRDPQLLANATRQHPEYDGVIRDVRDSLGWRTHKMVRAGLSPWFFRLYSDAVELSCPIGAFRGKLKVVFYYWALLNLSAEHRHSPLTNVKLASVCLAHTVKTYGSCAVVSGSRDDEGSWFDDSSFGGQMRQFYQGVHLTSVPGPRQYGALLQLATDGLEGAELIGTKCSVSKKTHRICRHCTVTSEQIHDSHDFFSSECAVLLTTLESHERDVELLAGHESHGWSKKSDLSKWFGLGGGENAFAGIVPGLPFDYVRLAPYDHLMHNEVCQGIAKKECELMLRHCIESPLHKLDFNLLNARILHADWAGDDCHSIPSVIDPKFLSGDHLIWTSAQMLNFALRSTALLHTLVDHSDPVWQCWSSHCRYLMMANQNQFTEQGVLDLHYAIIEHHKAYSALYPGAETAEFHWTLHMAIDILWNGPLKPMCCLRMEARHQYFKRLIKVSNRINPLYTLAPRYGRHVALARHGAVPRKLVEVCGFGATDEIDIASPGHVVAAA